MGDETEGSVEGQMEGQTEKRVINEDFEQEFYLNKEKLGELLISLGNQVKESNSITVTTEEWEIPFEFGEPVKVEIESEVSQEKELEIEIKFKGKK